MRISDWSSDVCSSDLGLASAIAMAAAMAGGSAQARPAAAQSPPGYTMPATQTWDMTADSGKSYRIFVSFPSEGKPPETGYPVLYVLDGNASFAAFAEARSEEHTSELQSLMRNSYAVFCLKKKHKQKT